MTRIEATDISYYLRTDNADELALLMEWLMAKYNLMRRDGLTDCFYLDFTPGPEDKEP